MICTMVFELLKQFHINFKNLFSNVISIGKQLHIMGSKEQCVTLDNCPYNYGFHNTFDYNHYVYSDYLVCSVPASAHIIRC